MKKAKIYKPAKTAMQSGLGKNDKWIVEYITKNPGINPLIGWESSTDTLSELKLEFSSKDSALDYAKRNKIIFEVVEPKQRKILKIISKINSSNTKFLAVTSYPSSDINVNTNRFGHHRYINMELDPFYLDRPFKIFDDNENQHNPRKLYIYQINEKS